MRSYIGENNDGVIIITIEPDGGVWMIGMYWGSLAEAQTSAEQKYGKMIWEKIN